MDKNGIRMLLLLLLAVGGWGCLSSRPLAVKGPSHTPCDGTSRDHVIHVYPTVISCKDADVSKNNQNKVDWYSPDGTQLEIRFLIENPFDHLDCRDHGKPTNHCSAYGPKGSDPDNKEFEYVAFINGEKTKDPNIIIRP